MAYDISKDFLSRLEFSNYPLMHIRIKFRLLIRAIRRTLNYLFPLKKRVFHKPEVIVTSHFEDTRAQYIGGHWAWVENIFPESFLKNLIAYWPPRRYFNPPRIIIKSYDVGFKWDRGDAIPEYIELFPELEALLAYLQSDEWSERLTDYTGSQKKISCNSFLANMTYPGSCIIPHKDTPLEDAGTLFLNMIFFIDGSGGGNSGELLLSHDSNQKDIFFVPTTLQNACLVYDTKGNFYHGFPPVARGTFRWVVTASFSAA